MSNQFIILTFINTLIYTLIDYLAITILNQVSLRI